MIWEAMEKGMASAAWIVGFVAVLGVLVGLLYVFCLVMKIAFDDEREEAGEDDGAPVADGSDAGLHAPAVGRHLRRGFGSDD